MPNLRGMAMKAMAKAVGIPPVELEPYAAQLVKGVIEGAYPGQPTQAIGLHSATTTGKWPSREAMQERLLSDDAQNLEPFKPIGVVWQGTHNGQDVFFVDVYRRRGDKSFRAVHRFSKKLGGGRKAIGGLEVLADPPMALPFKR
jgi:hypothetical protein